MPRMNQGHARTASFGALLPPGLAAALRAAAPAMADLTGLPAGEAALALGNGTLIVDASQPGAPELVERVVELRPHSAVIVIADDLPASIVRSLLRVRASDVLPSRSGQADILAALEHLTANDNEQTGAHAPVCAFVSAVGGAGATTIAIETACILARQRQGSRVCLIDLNIGDGMIASYLDARAQLDIAQLSAEPERLDETLLGAFTTRHKDGVSLICAPRDPEAWMRVNPDTLLAMLDIACASHDHVMLDLPRWRLPWSGPILAGADEVFAVSELTVPSLHAAAELARDIDRMRGHGRPARFVLNRFIEKAKHGRGISRQDAEKAIQRTIDVTVRSDWDAARAAVNLGMPVMGVKPSSPLVRDVAELVERFGAGQHQLEIARRRR